MRKLELKLWDTKRVCWGHLLEWNARHVLSDAIRTKVKDVDKEMLVQPVTVEEVKIALFSINGDKAPMMDLLSINKSGMLLA